MQNAKKTLFALFVTVTLCISGCAHAKPETTISTEKMEHFDSTITKIAESMAADQKQAEGFQNVNILTWKLTETIPAYTGKPYVALNDNVPYFTADEKTTDVFENYSELDSLGRCGVAYANICKELMPTEKRGEIGSVKPSGWHTAKYPDLIKDRYLYNRCHLIGFQLAGENANPKNLITGTRSLNIDGMLPFEDEVADYVKETGNHVLYRVTPIFYEDDLVARGVEIEGYSVEDQGAGVQFHVFAYNVQLGIAIDYATGESWETAGNMPLVLEETFPEESSTEDGDEVQVQVYVINTRTEKFHRPTCDSVKKIGKANKLEMVTNRDDLIAKGYEACKVCNP